MRISDISRIVWKTALRAAACVSVLVIAALSLLPADSMSRTDASPLIEHFVAYAGSAALAVLAWGDRARLASIVGGYALLAAALEFLQRWSPGRTPEFSTLTASALGAALAAVLVARLAAQPAAPADVTSHR